MASVDEWLRAAQQAVARSDWGEATRQYIRVLEHVENADALLHLSYSESNAGHYRLGREYAIRAATCRSLSASATIHLLNRLRSFNESGLLRETIDRSSLWDSKDPRILQLVSAQLSFIGDQESALRYVDKAVRLRPDVSQLKLARAQVNVFLGKFDAAERDISACLRTSPGLANAWWTWAGLRKQTPESNHVDQLRRMLATSNLKPADEAYLNYALHKELDDLGEIQAAGEALARACRARRTEQVYSDEKTKSLFRSLKNLPTGSSSAATAEFTPVFVVGMYRSGTTLLEQLLGGNPCMINAGELHDMTACMRNTIDHYCVGAIDETIVDRSTAADFEAVGHQYLDGVRWRVGAHTHITDKWPPNHVNVGFICQALPAAKIIHMVRDPVETCFSNLREMFSGAAPYSYDQVELASYHLQYQDLMGHWHQRFPGRVLDVHYSELTTNTEQVMRGVAAFCGMEFLPSMLDPRSATRSVATASAVQVRSSVVSRTKPKWEPYREYLQPMIRKLGVAM